MSELPVRIARVFGRLCLLFGILLFVSDSTVHAFEPSPWIGKVEAYLNDLTTLKARFSMTAQGAEPVDGAFWLDRPGKLRFEYDPPVGDFIVSDGLFVYYWDDELKQQTNAPLGATLADLILSKKIDLNKDVTVEALEERDGRLYLRLVKKDDPGSGSLTLGFAASPLQLLAWRVIDAQGLVTDIALHDIETGLDLPSSLFWFHRPR